MRFAAVAALAMGAVPALAAPICSSGCLSQSDAASLADIYAKLVGAFDKATGDKYLADNFTEYSDSINQLAGIPLGSVTFPTKAAFEAAQLANPAVPIKIDVIEAVQCNKIALSWHAPAWGAKQRPVKGISVVSGTKAAGYWQIDEIKVEFNALAWLEDMGGSYTNPAAPESAVTVLPGAEQ